MFKYLIAITLVLCSCCSCMNTDNGRTVFNQMSKEEITKRISENLPLGSEMSKVMEYAELNLGGGRYSPKENKAYAKIEQGGWLIQKSVCMVFTFDKEGKLASFEVDEIYTGT